MFEVIFCFVLFVLLLIFGVGFFASLLIVLIIDFVFYKPIMLFFARRVDTTVEDYIKSLSNNNSNFSLTKTVPGLSQYNQNKNHNFGQTSNNSIPVTIKTFSLYLHLLRTENQMPLFFHRIGSVKFSGRNLDVIELVSIDNNEWYLLYFDIYNREMSCQSPTGLHLLPLNQIDDKVKLHYSIVPWYGTPHSFLTNFPLDVPKAIKNFLEMNYKEPECLQLYEYFSKPVLEKLPLYEWVRPEAHQQKIKNLDLASQIGLDGGTIYKP